jgi:hypothetical protein
MRRFVSGTIMTLAFTILNPTYSAHVLANRQEKGPRSGVGATLVSSGANVA